MSDGTYRPPNRWTAWLSAPFLDVWHGLERSLTRGIPDLIRVFVGLAAGWWIYVPIHELLHAIGCLMTGGTVTRLEIAHLYGGEFFEGLIPFVVAGGDYAGRLSGFDTHGSDWTYLATDLLPFALTLFPGVWALRFAGAAPRRSLVYGASLPFALAPFLSLTGDAYEIGSILVTRLSPFEPFLELLRGDDLLLLPGRLAGQPGIAWLGFGLAALVGTLWAFGTYAIGAGIARFWGTRRDVPAL